MHVLLKCHNLLGSHDQIGINGVRNLVIVAKRVAKKNVNKVA